MCLQKVFYPPLSVSLKFCRSRKIRTTRSLLLPKCLSTEFKSIFRNSRMCRTSTDSSGKRRRINLMCVCMRVIFYFASVEFCPRRGKIKRKTIKFGQLAGKQMLIFIYILEVFNFINWWKSVGLWFLRFHSDIFRRCLIFLVFFHWTISIDEIGLAWSAGVSKSDVLHRPFSDKLKSSRIDEKSLSTVNLKVLEVFEWNVTRSDG